MIHTIIRSAIVTCTLGVSINAIAAEHTVSVGYAQTKADDFKDLKGINAQYRFEKEYPVGLVVSTSYVSGDEKSNYGYGEEKAEVKSFSLLAGPAYRFNQYVSAYALAGFANVKSNYSDREFDGSYSYSDNLTKTSFAYGVGIAVNPVQNISLYAGYEGTKVKFEGESAKLNGFNVGVGYRF
ncbi:Ail/Lom family outer membrane beta-barrel protein [Acinetobacter guillouiae]|uniref:Ail/Lom family outer membrane beta-barrel protein n=1 Tax=Acinetobacter guillouiae TaxID=106649 RepID=UPI002FD9827E